MVDNIINDMKDIKNQYLEKIKKLLKSARSKLSTTYEIQFKNVFGAVGGYVNRHIFISCGSFGFALRLPPEVLKKLFKEKDVKHLKYFPRGHIKKEYAVLPQQIIENKRQFRRLLDKSVKYALSSP